MPQLLLRFLLLFGLVLPASATLPPPSGPILLTIKGDISQRNNNGRSAQFDMKMLSELPLVQFQTSTPWDTHATYEGVLLSTLLRAVGAQPGDLMLTAQDDYQATFPIKYVEGAMLAFKRNGQPLTLRQKGPLRLIFDYDSDETFVSPVYRDLSVWQLIQIQVLPKTP